MDHIKSVLSQFKPIDFSRGTVTPPRVICAYPGCNEPANFKGWSPSIVPELQTLASCKKHHDLLIEKSRKIFLEKLPAKMVHFGFSRDLVNKVHSGERYLVGNVPNGEKTLRGLMEKVFAWSDSTDRRRLIVHLFGEAGRGKSYLGTRIAYFVMKHRVDLRCRCISDQKFAMDIKRTFGDKSLNQWDIYDKLVGVDVVMIDDFGIGSSDWTYGLWKGLMDEWEKFGSLVIITSNKDPVSLSKEESETFNASPLLSRIQEKGNIQIPFGNKDFRTE